MYTVYIYIYTCVYLFIYICVPESLNGAFEGFRKAKKVLFVGWVLGCTLELRGF